MKEEQQQLQPIELTSSPKQITFVSKRGEKQARKSSEDTQVSGYARFEKSLGRVSFGSKNFGPKFFLLIFSLNCIIFFFQFTHTPDQFQDILPRPKIFLSSFSLNLKVLRKHFFLPISGILPSPKLKNKMEI